VVDEVRQRFRLRRVGHGGTLDPAATGLLILLLGATTRKAGALLDADKSYLATLRLGVTTDTQDAQGRILETKEVGPIPREQIERICAQFRGQIEQEIPAYSAVRIGGRHSYALARAGVTIPRRTRPVTIHELKVLEVRLPEVDFSVSCSKGTYIRALCADIGAALGVGGHLGTLRRTRIGSFSIEQAVPLEKVKPEDLIPL
jgi:tRNA pseudouridine55 synthase